MELLSSDWILPSYRAHSSWLVGTVSTHSLKDSQLLICRDSIGALEAGISGHDGEEKSEQQPEDRRAAWHPPVRDNHPQPGSLPREEEKAGGAARPEEEENSEQLGLWCRVGQQGRVPALQEVHQEGVHPEAPVHRAQEHEGLGAAASRGEGPEMADKLPLASFRSPAQGRPAAQGLPLPEHGVGVRLRGRRGGGGHHRHNLHHLLLQPVTTASNSSNISVTDPAPVSPSGSPTET